jgi:predicted amidohydrolase YtcJ
MPERVALKDAAVYLGGGEVIEKGCVVVKGSTIESVGPACDLGGSRDLDVMDLAGKLILPGLTDCHLHLLGYARALVGLDLAGTASLDEGLHLIEQHLEGVPAGGWLRGRGWDKQRWGLQAFPTREMLDRVTGDRPAALASRDGHLMWVNSAVLQRIGLDREAVEVDGGEVEVDGAGRPTGILKENAAGLIRARGGDDRTEEDLAALEAASRKLIELGLTCVHTIEGGEDARTIDRAEERGSVGLDLVRLREVKDLSELDGLSPSPRAAFVKFYADGALGSQTASMFEPYQGQPGNTGIAVTGRRELGQLVRQSVEKGFAVAVHAIGDRANKEVLDIYQAVRQDLPDSDVPLRIEHAQILRGEDVGRFGRLSVVASMQPIHVVSDMRVAEAYWGPRCRHAYAWKSILRGGGILAFGSDAPIEDPDPLKGIHAALTRRSPEEHASPAWYGDERLTVTEAVDCYTSGAAVAGGRSAADGRIRAGARADLTVLERNILTPREPDVILDTAVHMTVIGGRIHTGR